MLAAGSDRYQRAEYLMVKAGSHLLLEGGTFADSYIQQHARVAHEYWPCGTLRFPGHDSHLQTILFHYGDHICLVVLIPAAQTQKGMLVWTGSNMVACSMGSM